MNRHDEDYNDIEQLLRGLPVRTPSETLDARVHATLAAHQEQRRPRLRRGRLAFAAVASLAACLLLGVVLDSSFRHPPAAPVPPENGHAQAQRAQEQRHRSVRQATMVASMGGHLLPTIALLHVDSASESD